jgi:hypothetical protein
MQATCVYCEQKKMTVHQRYDYAGNAAGIMCDECWTTSGLNPARNKLLQSINEKAEGVKDNKNVK